MSIKASNPTTIVKHPFKRAKQNDSGPRRHRSTLTSKRLGKAPPSTLIVKTPSSTRHSLAKRTPPRNLGLYLIRSEPASRLQCRRYLDENIGASAAPPSQSHRMTTLRTHTPAALSAAAPNTTQAVDACSSGAPVAAPTPAPTPGPAACATGLWTIERTTPSTLRETSQFVNAARRELFPGLGHDALLDDAGVLEGGCVLVARSTGGKDGEGDGDVIAAIAYTPFDYRFPHLPGLLGDAGSGSGSASASTTASSSSSSSSSSSLNLTTNTNTNSNTHTHTSTCLGTFQHPCKTVDVLRPCKTVEVLRLFVLPRYRRHGLAAALFRSLRDHALASGVQCMYLHTHPFLPGAIRFWEKQGFEIAHVDHEDQVWRTHHMSLMLDDTSKRRL